MTSCLDVSTCQANFFNWMSSKVTNNAFQVDDGNQDWYSDCHMFITDWDWWCLSRLKICENNLFVNKWVEVKNPRYLVGNYWIGYNL